MRFLLVVSVFLCAIPAQNQFIVYPERNGSSTTFVTRPSPGQVELLAEVTGSLFAGVGDNGSTCTVDGSFVYAIDEDGTTAETYSMAFRLPAMGGGPDPNPSGLIAKIGPFTAPTGAGRRSYRLSVTFMTPVTVPDTGGFYHGIELANGNWPTDGASVQAAYYNPPMGSVYGDNPRAGAPYIAWGVDLGTLSQTSSDYTWRMGIYVDNPVLNVGGIDPMSTRQRPAGSTCYGAGGLFPDISGSPRSDGLDLRVEHRAPTNAIAAALVAAQISNFGLQLVGVQNRLWIDVVTAFPVSTQPALQLPGVAVIPIAMPGTLPFFLKGIVPFQCVVVDQSTLKATFTNAAAVSY